MRLGIVIDKSCALSVDQCRLQALQFSVHLIELLNILLRCNDFARIQKAVVDQASSRPTVTFVGSGLALGSALKFLSPATEPVVSYWSFNGPEPGCPESTMRKWKKERIIFPGLRSRLSCSRDQPEIERERERKKERKKDTGTQAPMEQRCFNQHGVGIYTVLQGSYSQQR